MHVELLAEEPMEEHVYFHQAPSSCNSYTSQMIYQCGGKPDLMSWHTSHG